MTCRSGGATLPRTAPKVVVPLFVSLILGCVTCRAQAEEPLEEVSIAYDRSACGSRDAFIERVHSRTHRFELREPSAENRHFQVSIRKVPTGYLGELRIVSSDGEDTTRTIDGTACEELFDAVALMTALAIDPSVPLTDPGGPASTEPNGSDSEGESPDQGKDSLPVLRPETATSRALDQPKTRGKAAPVSESVPAEAPLRGRMGGGFLVRGGVVEKALLGGQFHLEVQGKWSDILAPSMRVGGSFQSSARVSGSVGEAQFTLAAGNLEACPVRLPLGGPYLRPCLSGTVGGLRGRGLELDDERSETRLYSAWGGSARLEFPLHRLISFEGGAGFQLPLRRDRFIIESSVVSQAAPVTASGWAGLGLWFY